MSEEAKKDLAQEEGKVDVNVKIDTSGLEKVLKDFTDEIGTKITNIPGDRLADGLSEGDKKTLNQYSIAKAILKKAHAQAGLDKFDGVEREMHEEAVREAKNAEVKIDGMGVPLIALRHMKAQTRADLQATVDAAGGYTVATELPGFIDTLKNTMVAMKAGAVLMTGLEGDISIPRLATNSTSTWRSEGGVATESDPTFEAVTMTPNRLTTYTIYSQQLLRQSSVDVERIVRENLFYSVANALEKAIFEGSGSSNQPTGILNATGVNDATHGSSNPTAMTWTNIVNMEKMVAVDNALMARLAYVFDTQAAAKAKVTLKNDYQGGYIWENLSTLRDGIVNGYNAYTSNIFTDNTIIFGNFSDIMVGQWGGLDLLVNPYSLDTYAQIRVVIAGYYDVALRHGQSFARIDDSAV